MFCYFRGDEALLKTFKMIADLNINSILIYSTLVSFRTKWKRQTAVGLELLAEAGNYAAVQRMLQTNPYWSAYAPTHSTIISNLDAMYFRPGTPMAPQRPLLPRMFIHGLQQHISHLPPPQLYSSTEPRT